MMSALPIAQLCMLAAAFIHVAKAGTPTRAEMVEESFNEATRLLTQANFASAAVKKIQFTVTNPPQDDLMETVINDPLLRETVANYRVGTLKANLIDAGTAFMAKKTGMKHTDVMKDKKLQQLNHDASECVRAAVAFSVGEVQGNLTTLMEAARAKLKTNDAVCHKVCLKKLEGLTALGKCVLVSTK